MDVQEVVLRTIPIHHCFVEQYVKYRSMTEVGLKMQTPYEHTSDEIRVRNWNLRNSRVMKLQLVSLVTGLNSKKKPEL
jgi:hypothetical protein